MSGFDPRFERELERAVRLKEDFSGYEAEAIGRVAKPVAPDVAVVIGYCDGLLYSADRDGSVKRYIHTFARADRPLFLVSPDGRQLMLHGGDYDFTERGIVDRSRR